MEEWCRGLLHLSKLVVHLHLPACSLLPKSTCLPASPSASSPSTPSLRASSTLFVFFSPSPPPLIATFWGL